MWTKLDIINLAFNVLNKSSVNSLSDAGEFADSASRAYDLLLPAELSSQSWRFATKTQQLSVLASPPTLVLWKFMLQIPHDYLSTVRVYPNVNYQIFEDKMFSNSKSIRLEYRFIPPATMLPAYFVHFFSLKLASWFADAVAQDDGLSNKLEQKANFELQKALFTDSQSHPTPAMRTARIISVRGGGGEGFQ